MPRKRIQKVDKEEVIILRKEAHDWDMWDSLRKSPHGKFLLEWLDAAIEETLNHEDTKDIYSMDQQAREYFFASVRSKRQTLKALKDKLLKAEGEKHWRAEELAKLQPE